MDDEFNALDYELLTIHHKCWGLLSTSCSALKYGPFEMYVQYFVGRFPDKIQSRSEPNRPLVVQWDPETHL